MSEIYSPFNNKKEIFQKNDKINNNSNELNPQIRNLNIINNTNNKSFPMFIGKKETKEKKIEINQKEKKEKNYSIHLNINIKTKEKETKSELLEINFIESLIQKEPILIISMKNQHDPLFLFSLELKEEEYQQLKDEQSLLVDFQNFSDFALKMLNFCKNDKNGIFSCILNIEDNLAVLAVEEKTQYRKFNHLILKFKEVNDINLKNHFNQILKEYQSKIESLSKINCELNQIYQNSKEDYNILKSKYEKLEREQKASIDDLLNSKSKEINGIKENLIKETRTKLEALENDKNNIIHDLEKKISEFQSSIDELTNNKSNLEKDKLKLENSQQILEQENISLKLEVSKLKAEISDLNQKNTNLEKEIIQLKLKNENSFKELKDKSKLIENLNKYKNLNEDNVQNLKLNNNKLEKKLMMSINEINKANDIIEKLQNEIKNQKNKLKNMKIEIINKEKIISQKQAVLDEQNISIQNIKKDNEDKGKEIFSLTNKISIKR